MSDFTLYDGGSVLLLKAVTEDAKEWEREHLPEEAQRLGDAVAIERRYIADIVEGILAYGLNIEEELGIPLTR